MIHGVVPLLNDFSVYVLGFYEKCEEIRWSFLETIKFRCNQNCRPYSKFIPIWLFHRQICASDCTTTQKDND
jgi:hypothetical protein